jgi:hypothetical protein
MRITGGKMIGFEYAKQKLIDIMGTVSCIYLAIDHLYICIAVTQFLIILHIMTIVEGRNQILQIASVGEIIELTKPNIH